MTGNSFVRPHVGHDANAVALEDGSHLKSKDLQDNMVQKITFSSPRCSSCNDEMQFLEGDVIYGDKWYHSLCWKEIQKMVEMVHGEL